jgi:hypothetical protein
MAAQAGCTAALLSVALALAPVGPARADFEVYCVADGDGRTTSCEGWRGGETLTCVASAAGVSTCAVPSGRRFTCVTGLGGVTSCADNPANRPDADGTACTFTGDGSFSCTPPTPRSEPLLPAPRLPSLTPPASPAPVITNPSVFDP